MCNTLHLSHTQNFMKMPPLIAEKYESETVQNSKIEKNAPQKQVNNRRMLAWWGSKKPYILGFGHTNFDKSWSMYRI